MRSENKKTILLVEDEKLIAMAEKMSLEKYGYTVITASTGEKAVETLEKISGIDMILMDINLGSGIDGTQTAQIILKKHDLPILFLSSHAECKVVEKTEGITSYGYSIKNSGESVLIASIKMAFKVFEANKKILESEKRLQDVYKLANIGIWDWKADTDTVTWSDELYRIAGLDPMLPAPTYAEHSTFCSPESWQNLNTAVERTMKTGEPYQLDLKLIRLDGTIRYVIAFGAVKYDTNGRVNGLYGSMQDITYRKQMEEALRESEERFRILLKDVQSVAIQGYGPDGTTHFWNQASEWLYGYSAAEAIGRNLLDLVVPPEMQEDFKQAIRLMAETGEPIPSAELSLMRKDGSRVSVFSYHTIIQMPGRIQELFCFDIDLTERKRTDEVLRQSENKYRLLSENVTDGVSLFENNKVSYVSEGYLSMLGYDKHEIESISFEDIFSFIHVDDAKQIKKIIEEAHLQLAKKIQYCYRVKTKKGECIWVEDVVNVEYDSLGNHLRSIIHSRDITERKLAEDATTAALSLLNASIESTADGILIVDRNGKITRYNQKFAELWHLSKEVLSNKEDTIVINHILSQLSEPEQFVAKVRYLYDHPEESSFDQIEFLDGCSFERYSQPQKIGGDVVGRVWSFRDITERKRAEDEKRIMEDRLQHADKMEAIGTLAGGIAHDFNNLLMGIQGYASLALMNLDPTHPNYERLKRIEEQVQSGADLTRQLLGFARGGRYEVKPSDMNEIVQKTCSMFGRTKKEIAIHLKHGKDLWSVEVDRGQMEQVFMNLYVNAWHAMPGGGEIYLETENVFLNDDQAILYSIKPGNYVKITVTDTGTGMDEKTKDRIFDPFFTTKEMGRGTGMGLATVYGIIKGHHGMINVYSEPGHGTTFTLYFPASDKEVVKEETATVTIDRGTETILLVDDEKTVLEVSRELLESMGYQVYAVGSGQEAIAVYIENKYQIDLVILDMIMPGISGADTFDRLREINPVVKVILSSGYSLNGKAQTIMDRGCNGFLQKPFYREQLSTKIRETLN